MSNQNWVGGFSKVPANRRSAGLRIQGKEELLSLDAGAGNTLHVVFLHEDEHDNHGNS